jgi:hypothetical protein
LWLLMFYSITFMFCVHFGIPWRLYGLIRTVLQITYILLNDKNNRFLIGNNIWILRVIFKICILM